MTKTLNKIALLCLIAVVAACLCLGLTLQLTASAEETHVHIWGHPVWHWSAGYTSATATFTCTVCGQTQTAQAQGNDIVKQSQNDRTVYTATVTFDGKVYNSQTEDLLPVTAPPQGGGSSDIAPEVDLTGAVLLALAQVLLLVIIGVFVSRRFQKRAA